MAGLGYAVRRPRTRPLRSLVPADFAFFKLPVSPNTNRGAVIVVIIVYNYDGHYNNKIHIINSNNHSCVSKFNR